MPTTLQQPQTKPHYMAQATAPSQQVSSATPAQTLLDSHVIEPELLQGFPRQVKHRRHHPLWQYYPLALGALLPLLSLFFAGNNAPWMIPLSLVIYVIMAAIIFQKIVYDPARDRYLIDVLRYGAAVPAVVSTVHRTGDHIHAKYICYDQFGEMQTGVLNMNGHDVPKQDMKVGDTFTVVLSHEDRTIFPYFYFSDYRIVPTPATAVSKQVTTTLQAQELLVPKQLVSSLGMIEPELLHTAPRKVEYLRRSSQLWWTGLAVAVLASVATFYPVMEQAVYHQGFLALLMLVNGYILYNVFSKRFMRNILMRQGIPARARVTDVDVHHQQNSPPLPDEKIPVTYQYEARDGNIHTYTVSMTRRLIWHYGIAEGATFTVLYHPAAPAEAYPYFLLTDTRIIGATTIKVTPP